jgi:colicin import membrane protein
MQHAYQDDPGKWSAALLALFMHGVLALALVMSVRWQTRPVTVQAEIWVAAPSEPAPVVEEAPPPPLPPEQVRAKPAPEPEIAPPARPDIKLKAPPPKPKVEPKTEKPAAPSFDELLAREETQLDRRKIEQDKQRRAEEEARGFAQARADQEAKKRTAALLRAKADYQSKLRGKIRGNIVQPPNLNGNPVAQFAVTQLPSGEIIDVRRQRGSGNALYDDAVERAIRKSSPLPRPDDPGVFSRDLNLTFCPDEEKGCR